MARITRFIGLYFVYIVIGILLLLSGGLLSVFATLAFVNIGKIMIFGGSIGLTGLIGIMAIYIGGKCLKVAGRIQRKVIDKLPDAED